MTRLLDPVVADNETLDALIHNADDPRWNDEDLAKSLKRRLGKQYDRFFRVVGRMNELVISLKKLLDINQTHIHWAKSGDRPPLEFHLKRIRISFSKRKNVKVKKLEIHNRELESILGCSDQIMPIGEARALSRPVVFYERFHQHACGLYNALGQHWKCTSSCCRSHEVHILLRAEPNEVLAEVTLMFALEINEEESRSTGFPTKFSREVNVKPGKKNDRTAYLTAITQASDLQQPKKPPVPGEHLCDNINEQKGAGINGILSKASEEMLPIKSDSGVCSKHAKQVRFESPTPTITISRGVETHSATTATTVTEGNNNVSSQCAPDLCTPLRNRGRQAEVGTISDRFNNRFELEVADSFDASMARAPDAARLIPLPELLDAYRQDNINLTRRRRFEMAAHIASALFQIQMSPWVPVNWSKQDFSFLADSENIYSSYPFVSRALPSRSTNPQTQTSSLIEKPVSTFTEEDIRTSLFAIGVIILELIFGHSIETCSFRHQYLSADNRPNDQTDISTARKWARKVLDECGADIADVVRRCLDCSFGPRPSFEDRRFREAVYKCVVGPLLNYLSAWPKYTP
ncbi:hypothetical protein FQN54_002955 [Arachnomyces sp. PD_36]|nr:hypothetical protein FQN54_002955 [Arachnomyces sp. PD_36]